ncbi:MAG: site-2 protease family protein [Solirubrobacteraceae bacterium]|nr:site-2 protease family protein [Solirubrobacteraceae bacterium]
MSWVLAFLGFAVLIILHELGHFAAAKWVGMRVERFALFFPPLVARRQRGETEYAIGAIPLGGYVKITGMNPEEEIDEDVVDRAYYRQPVWKRIVVIGAGPAVNIVLAFVILWGIFFFAGTPYATPQIESLQKGSPAAAVLQPGDRILSVDGVAGYAPGVPVPELEKRAAAVRKAINTDRACAGGAKTQDCVATEPVTVVYERDGQQRTAEITPRYDTTAKRFLLGFGFGMDRDPQSAVESADLGVTGMWNVTTLTVENIVKLFYDDEARKQVSGVVGSYEATRQSWEFDAVQALTVLALISLSLGIINLFPFLPLDGGHIFWALAEKVGGRPIPLRVMERASVVGIMLVAFLFIVGLSNDVGRITSGEGFGVR